MVAAHEQTSDCAPNPGVFCADSPEDRADEARLARLLADLGMTEDFEDAWAGFIEHDWRHQHWPTFKDMARDLFTAGYELAVRNMRNPADTIAARQRLRQRHAVHPSDY